MSTYAKQLCRSFFMKTKQVQVKYLLWDNLGFWGIQCKGCSSWNAKRRTCTEQEWVNLKLLLDVFPNLAMATIYVPTFHPTILDHVLSVVQQNRNLKLCIKCNSYGAHFAEH